MIKRTSTIKNIYQLTSIIVYILSLLTASLTLLFPPNNFDAKAIIVPLVLLLFISAIAIGQRFTIHSQNRLLSILGTISIAVLMTFVGFFIVAAVAWFIGVAQAQY